MTTSKTIYPTWINEKAFMIQTDVQTLDDGRVQVSDMNSGYKVIANTLSEGLSLLNETIQNAMLQGNYEEDSSHSV